ncbi:S1C family serine protease [Luteolibacter algae]|uniref:S1C family serine protease n=1 Tax=Luteolibacter algae TaxID=454151 RepID=A0ABW5D6Y3_9BACT
MKIKFTIISASGIIGGLSICPFNVVQAIEPAPESTQPPAILREKFEAKAVRPNEQVPFIGLATATLPSMVADHLNLESDAGVIIRTICPNSPAQKAGLFINDIILNIDGAEINSPETLSSIVRGHKTGDRLSIDLIHKGKPAKVEVTIGNRPADHVAQLNQEPLLEGLPKAHADRLRGLIEQNLEAFGAGNASAFSDPQLQNTFRMMREQMNHSLEEAVPPILQDKKGGISFQQSSTVRMMDNNGSIEIKSNGDVSEVTVRDTDNKIVWSGPWNTEEDKLAAPEDIRSRIDKVKSGTGGGLNLRFRKLDSKPDVLEN